MKILICNYSDVANYHWIPIPVSVILRDGATIECEQGEAEKIVCHDLFSSCPRYKTFDLLKYIAKKVKFGGKIVIIEPDLTNLLLRYYLHRTITIDHLNDLIFEDSAEIRSIVDPKELEEVLKELNFETSVNCQNGYITIEGTRKE